MMEYFEKKKGKDPTKIELVSVKAEKNSLQGIHSQTFVVDVIYADDNPVVGKQKHLYIYLSFPSNIAVIILQMSLKMYHQKMMKAEGPKASLSKFRSKPPTKWKN